MSARLVSSLLLLLFTMVKAAAAMPNALEEFVALPDKAFKWEVQDVDATQSVARLQLTSQSWKGGEWTHDLLIVTPKVVKNPESCFLFIRGSGDGSSMISRLRQVAEASGACAAVLADVPNQPLMGGRTEDSLIAYSLQKYRETGDVTWPALFPMVRSAVSAMTAIQEFKKSQGIDVSKFVLSGASKRGWTTWLTAAVDSRVLAIAPMVIDVLNMEAQMEWARSIYGKDSEKVRDYTVLGLTQAFKDERVRNLVSWIDPYAYRSRLKQPKLILLGTNDRYWVVDSLRHYWHELPEPKQVFQVPNEGHDLGNGEDVWQTISTWAGFVMSGEKLPAFKWRFESPQGADGKVHLEWSESPDTVKLWTAHSDHRDFREARWSASTVASEGGKTVALKKPEKGFTAYMVEVSFTTRFGPLKLSSEVRVLPDHVIQSSR
jgi:PhoPQ-activated pathogenicity-related protein